jgi:hypothetical protein
VQTGRDIYLPSIVQNGGMCSTLGDLAEKLPIFGQSFIEQLQSTRGEQKLLPMLILHAYAIRMSFQNPFFTAFTCAQLQFMRGTMP